MESLLRPRLLDIMQNWWLWLHSRGNSCLPILAPFNRECMQMVLGVGPRLTHGANVNSTSSGATALHAACERGDEYLVHLPALHVSSFPACTARCLYPWHRSHRPKQCQAGLDSKHVKHESRQTFPTMGAALSTLVWTLHSGRLVRSRADPSINDESGATAFVQASAGPPERGLFSKAQNSQNARFPICFPFKPEEVTIRAPKMAR